MENSDPSSTAPLVFVSYNHKDDRWRARLNTFLKPAVDSGSIRLWDDQNVGTGEQWHSRIREAIDDAAVAVLLISADYLASTWITTEEATQLLKRSEAGGLRIFPILLRPCAWETVDWLRTLQIFSADKALVERSRVAQDKLLSEAVKRIMDLARHQSDGKLFSTGHSGIDQVVTLKRPVPPPVRSESPDRSSRPVPPPVTSRPTPPARSRPVPPPVSSGATAPAPSSRPLPPTTENLRVDALSSFVLSNEARNILRRAQVLGTFGDTDQAKVTSSCLLFGISEGGREQTGPFRTPQFFWRELQRADAESYSRIFRERFPGVSYSSAKVGTIAFDRFDKLAEPITENVLQLFRRAHEISLATLAPPQPKKTSSKTGRGEEQFPGHIGARHLLAALLVQEETNAFGRLSGILDIAQLRGQFLEFIGKSLPDDDFAAWQEVLGVQSPGTEDEPVVTTQPVQEPSAPLAGYSADDWHGEDLLGITRDVNALAALVAARSIDPPLSIGLFGDWGSGKTHFMRQMRARVQKLSQGARESERPQVELGYHKRIVQIEFNAWHYIEGNLWASLVEHIFDNLRIIGQRDGHTEVEDVRETIMEQLELKQELQKKVEQRQLELKSEAEAAKNRAEEAKNKRDDTSQDLVNLRDAPKAGVIDQLTTIELSPEQKALLDQLGISERAQRLPSEIYKRYEEAQTLWGRIRAQGKVLGADPNRGKQFVRLAVVIGITVAVGLLFRNALKSVYAYLATAVAFVGAFWAAAKPYFETFRKSMATLKEKYDHIEQERQKQIVALESEVHSLTRELTQAESDAKAINKEVSTLETQLKSTDAAKLLAGFVEDRAACEDYRRHLGVLALIRRDFEKLSNLLSEQRRDELKRSETPENQKAFSRIILYIDDLDRCPPERVVQVLQAIHLLLAFPLFVVVVGVDARWVTRSLRESYDWLGVDGDKDNDKDKERDKDNEPHQEKREMVEDRVVTPHDYLEKIFQIPFWLKPMGPRDCEKLLNGLTRESRAASLAQSNGDEMEEKGKDERTTGAVSGILDTNLGTEQVEKTRTQPAQPSIKAEGDPPSDQSEINETPATAGTPMKHASAEIVKPIETFSAQAKQTDEDPIDLTPQSLTLTEVEIKFMIKLTSLIGRSPRAVKRFLNCYRLIKVGLTQAELDSFMGQDGKQGRYEAVMILLGIITGAPAVSLYVIEEFEEYSRSKKTMNLNALLLKLEENPEVRKQPDWIRVREILEDQIGYDELGITLASLIKEAPRVSRYSFRVAKVVAAQKRVGPPNKAGGESSRPRTGNRSVAG